MSPFEPTATATPRQGERSGRARISVEVFPPRTPEAEANLWACVARLAPLDPTFVSVTYGAGGTTRDRTHGVVRRLLDETQLSPAAHLTCVAASRYEVDAVVRDYWHAGVRHIVALRGDPPAGAGRAFERHPHGYANATELVAGIRAIAPFEISVACYPEKHPESPSLDFDVEVLKAKVDAGAARAISQFFFEAETFLRFAERVRRAGVEIPLVPGIMPIANLAGAVRMASACGAAVPEALVRRFEAAGPADQARIAVETATELSARLVDEGFEDLHLYTLNRADLAADICRNLSVQGVAADAEAAQ